MSDIFFAFFSKDSYTEDNKNVRTYIKGHINRYKEYERKIRK